MAPARFDADAVVVGSGPNGLAAAVTLAQAGCSVTVLEAADEIGGGTRSSELTVPGVLHDHCSAIHPFAATSPFLSTLGLERFGLRWRWSEIALAHPLDDGTAAVMYQSIDATAAGLGADGAAWRRTFGPLAERYDEFLSAAMAPVVGVPRHPLTSARLGLRAGLPATVLARQFRSEAGRALWGGVAAHLIERLDRPMSSAVGVALVTGSHGAGWPVAEGGSHAITKALATLLASLGGRIETGRRVASLAELGGARLKLFDVAPRAFAALAGDALPGRVRSALTRWQHGPAAFKVDFAVEGGVPWTAEACRRAGTVHLSGSFDETVAVERVVARGRMPERPFVLVTQQYLADPGRSSGDVHPVWTYAHVPHGYPGDAADAVVRQIERFAPGFRERVVAQVSTTPAQFEAANANFVGGDILTGRNSLRQLVVRPRLSWDPYATGIPGVYLCSAATPPGAGAHGMCGHNAALRALRTL